MSDKSVNGKLHWPKRVYDNKVIVYICNWTFSANPAKLARHKSDVTCQNCLQILRSGKRD